MTDPQQAAPGPETDTGARPAPAAAAANREATAAARGGGPLLLNLLLLGALGALAALYWQQRQALEVLAGDSYALQQGQAALDQRLAAAEAARAGLATELQAALTATAAASTSDELTALRSELDALRHELVIRTTSSAADWSRLEAAALLRLARQQALSASTLPAAIRLYQDAANLLRQNSDAALQPARAAVQLELDALRSVELPPVEDLYLQLGQLAQQLDSLQVQSEDEAPLRFTAPAPATLPASASWREQLQQTLAQYFVVRRQDAPLLARLTPEQGFLVRQSLRLQLESARLALLQGDTALYQATLDAARDGITAQLQGAAKPAVLASLQRLRDTHIAISLPTLGAALRTLEQLDHSAGDTPAAPATPATPAAPAAAQAPAATDAADAAEAAGTP